MSIVVIFTNTAVDIILILCTTFIFVIFNINIIKKIVDKLYNFMFNGRMKNNVKQK